MAPQVTPLRKLRRESMGFATGVALIEHLSAEQAHDHVWRPDAYGSICFLVAALLVRPPRTALADAAP